MQWRGVGQVGEGLGVRAAVVEARAWELAGVCCDEAVEGMRR